MLRACAPIEKRAKKREQAIGNRGPLRLGDNGKLHPDILEAFHTQGFYIFEGVIDADEIAALRHDANNMLERAREPRRQSRRTRPTRTRDRLCPPALLHLPLELLPSGRYSATRRAAPHTNDATQARSGCTGRRRLHHVLHVPID